MGARRACGSWFLWALRGSQEFYPILGSFPLQFPLLVLGIGVSSEGLEYFPGSNLQIWVSTRFLFGSGEEPSRCLVSGAGRGISSIFWVLIFLLLLANIDYLVRL